MYEVLLRAYTGPLLLLDELPLFIRKYFSLSLIMLLVLKIIMSVINIVIPGFLLIFQDF